MIPCTCESCGKEFTAPRGRKYCTKSCQSRKKRDLIGELTPLNVATTLRYLACTHRFDGTYIVREVGAKDHVMSICVDCGVPIPAKYQLWNGRVSENGYNGMEAA